ncbi:hypothetical protein EGW08_010574 [Elysia chlorotica]|uniref:C-type lectin domain-containing protein n=1 Tax=Elysia chlorotica TaxID=188477 RepID=A0A433TJ95_ELYCH|nr:hypothetical protein EGW08_010574 [Elysia chlorotica]
MRMLQHLTICCSFLHFLTGPDTGALAALTREISFVKNINPQAQSHDPANSHVTGERVLSKFMCGAQCLAAFPACTSYLHNASTGLCVPAPEPTSLVTQMESGLGDLYVTCDTPGGFSMYRHGSAAACIAVIKSPKVNFTLAASYCEQMGGYLASVKTLDKLKMFNELLGDASNFWVGMDDMVEEGRYVWLEDGTEAFRENATYSSRQMAEIAMNGLWDHPREPNNFENDEHCIQLKQSTTHGELRLNDYKCYTNSKFICEERTRFV